MDFQSLLEKLSVLAESARYDVSCSSSGSSRAAKSGSLGTAATCGICHSFTEDGRCISLLKTLMTNDCAYDCAYCVNRRSNDVQRVSLEPAEVCEIVMEFYRHNYIEGLFLSSAVQHSPGHTMQKLTDTVVMLREVYRFNGYIHLKGIPSADRELIERASMFVDRMSFNIELPSESSLKLLAPQKNKAGIIKPMRMLADNYIEQKSARGRMRAIPAGQTTQMIVGATRESDGLILRLSQGLYHNFGLKRVYYSAYVPVVSNPLLPAVPPDLLRENRLYQADWLLRFYGFSAEEIVPLDVDLAREVDPKCGWALRNMNIFPVEVNTAPHEMLLRVPGIGVRSAYKILQARRYTRLCYEDLKRMRVVLKRAKHFITCGGKFYGAGTDPAVLTPLLAAGEQQGKQLSMFADRETQLSALTGEV